MMTPDVTVCGVSWVPIPIRDDRLRAGGDRPAVSDRDRHREGGQLAAQLSVN